MAASAHFDTARISARRVLFKQKTTADLSGAWTAAEASGKGGNVFAQGVVPLVPRRGEAIGVLPVTAEWRVWVGAWELQVEAPACEVLLFKRWAWAPPLRRQGSFVALAGMSRIFPIARRSPLWESPGPGMCVNPNRRRCVALLVNTTNGHYDLPANAPPDALVEVDAAKYIEAYEAGIRLAGCEPLVHEGFPDLDVIAWLRQVQPHLCFNVCEGFGGESREAHMPAVLEALGLPYSGPAPLAAAVTQDKPTTKRLLAAVGLPTPQFEVFDCPGAAVGCRVPFPLFVKPAHEGTGMGIQNESIVTCAAQLRGQVERILRHYRQPALVESFIEGRDLTCGVVGNNGDFEVLPVLEVDFGGYPPELLPVYSSKHKHELDHLFRYRCPAPLPEAIAQEVRRLTVETFAVTGCRDYARVDFRLTPAGQLYILEINALPGITPRSDMTMMAKASGRTHAQLVAAVLAAALKRYGLQ